MSRTALLVASTLTFLSTMPVFAAPRATAAGSASEAGPGATARGSSSTHQAAAHQPRRQETMHGIATVTLPSAGSPLVAIRLQFGVGSANDPAGKEGLAALTALMVAEAGTRKHSYTELLEELYPLAARLDSQVDREVTGFSGIVHRDTLGAYTAILTEVLLEPAFGESDLARNRDQLVSRLTNGLRGGNDEVLGLETFQDVLFAGHPYGHPTAGSVAGLNSITVEDVRRFYQEHYTKANLLVGVAGGYASSSHSAHSATGGGYVEELTAALASLPRGQVDRLVLPPPPATSGHRFVLVEKQTSSVGIHLGYPLPINRSDPDFYPLMVANSALGEHRTSNGRLMNELREARGLNYGDYSYIEFWSNPPGTRTPPPGVPRRQQYFSVWLRPVVPADAHFALRAALYQVKRLHDKGLSQAEFELTRSFLIRYSKLWVQTLPARLGYAMDSRFYGMPPFIEEIEHRLSRLTLEDVNRAIRKYISADSYTALIVTADAAKLKQALESDAPSPKQYDTQVAPEVKAADRDIEKLPVAPTAVEIVPVASLFN